jgi:hypothetical protein
MNKLGHEKGMFDVSLDVAPDIITLPFFFLIYQLYNKFN